METRSAKWILGIFLRGFFVLLGWTSSKWASLWWVWLRMFCSLHTDYPERAGQARSMAGFRADTVVRVYRRKFIENGGGGGEWRFTLFTKGEGNPFESSGNRWTLPEGPVIVSFLSHQFERHRKRDPIGMQAPCATTPCAIDQLRLKPVAGSSVASAWS
jgi:hypothetical protein